MTCIASGHLIVYLTLEHAISASSRELRVGACPLLEMPLMAVTRILGTRRHRENSVRNVITHYVMSSFQTHGCQSQPLSSSEFLKRRQTPTHHEALTNFGSSLRGCAPFSAKTTRRPHSFPLLILNP